ncbi:MAG: PfkB family carbohydrate kinase [Kofleriaceae bacterium]|nr:PfkB family carbohydrate kinase [Kofleriaceae bacterium]
MSTSDEAVVVWGEVLWDRFPEGAQLGGAPANVAWHLGQAGGWARLVTRVGDDDDGRLAVSVLAEMVDTSLVQVDPERATGEVGVQLDRGEARYTLHPNRAWERIACTDAVKTALAEAGVMVFGTLAQRSPEGLAAWRAAAAAARGTCTRVCDLNLRPGDKQIAAIREAIDAADVLKVNDRELGALRGLLGWPDPLAELRARKQILAVTHGEAGSTIYGEGAAISIPGVRATPGGDNVGCGDAYVAILVLGMTMGWDLETSGLAASRYAAAVASRRGATPRFTEEEIAELLGDVE